MKKKNLKYVLIPAFAATTLFPVLANDNQALASENSDTVSAPVNNTVNGDTTPTPGNQTSNTTTNSSSTTDVKPIVASNDNEVSTTNTKENITSKPTIPFTVAEYKQKSALELAKLIREKKVTSTELVDLAYKVIADENPKLNAVLTTENGKIPNAIVDEAYRTAKEIDERIKAGNLAANPVNWEEQPFLGVPTLIKGLDLLKDGDASNGVYFNKGKVSKISGAVAKEFTKLGFVILGQTNYPELGTRNITDSKLFGPAGNPWDPSRNTGGSSGGSAGAVASGMVSIASGSDAGGSIRIPASWTGLIGLKPTGHVVKFPLVKTIEDAKTYFDKTQIGKPKTLEEVPTDLKKLKIAYSLKTPLKDVELSEDGKKAVLKAVEFLRKQGFTVEEVNEFPIDGYEGIRTYTIGAIGGAYSAPAKSATEENKRDLDPATYALGTSSYRGKTGNTDVSSAKPASEYINKMNEFYGKYDLFLMATNAVTAPSNDKKVDPYVDPTVEEKLYNINEIKDPKERFNLLVKQWEPMMRRTPFTWLFNLTGNPAISLPVYKSENNLPLGVMFAAKNNSEKILLEMGQLFQDNNQFIMHPNVRNTVVAENGNKVRENEYGTKYEYSVPNEAPVTDALKPFTGKVDGLSESGNKVVVDENGNVSEFNTPADAPVADALKPFTGKIDSLSENGNKVIIDKDGNVSEFNTPSDAPVVEALKPFTGKIDELSENGNKVIVDKDGNVSEFNTPNDAPVVEALKPFTGKIDGLSENGNKVEVDNDGNVSEFNTPTDSPTSEALSPFTGKIDGLSENGNKVVVDKNGNISEFNTPADTPVAEALSPFTGKIDGLSENGNKVVVDENGNVSEFNNSADAPVVDALKPFTGKVDGLSESGNKVVVDKDGNISEFNTPADAPVAEALKPFTGKIDGLSENGNKVVVDENGSVSEFNTPAETPVVDVLKPFTGKVNELSANGNKVVVDENGNVSEFNNPADAPVADALKPFTGKIDGLSVNSNKVVVDNDGNISEFNKPKESPSVEKLSKLTINNETTSVTIKSNDDKINVELDSKYSKDISFKTTDITKEVDLEDLKTKIISDDKNQIKNKDEISSIRVLDLELQNNNKKVNLNIPRTVHIALLQNEQDKEILVYHIKEDNTIELIPSSTAGGNLQFTVDHFSKFAIIAKIKTALASGEKDINTSAVQEEKKFTVVNAKGAKSTPTNPPKTLPKTGETNNNILTLLGISLIALTALLKRRKNR